MSLESQLSFTLAILVAAILSMVIGLNRERREKAAGLRTHMLVGVGACMFTLLSYEAFPGSDPSRVAANVVTGIGFLGAGIIYRGKAAVHDLTTAADIWMTAAIGMAVGVRAWLLAINATIIVWVILDVLWRVKQHAIEQAQAEAAAIDRDEDQDEADEDQDEDKRRAYNRSVS